MTGVSSIIVQSVVSYIASLAGDSNIVSRAGVSDIFDMPGLKKNISARTGISKQLAPMRMLLALLQ